MKQSLISGKRLALILLTMLELCAMAGQGSSPAEATGSDGPFSPETLTTMAFAPTPGWLQRDGTKHLIRWPSLTLIEVVGRDQLDSVEAAWVFDRALSDFAAGIGVKQLLRKDITIAPDGIISDPNWVRRDLANTKLLVVITPFTDQDYLLGADLSVEGGTGENYQQVHIVPVEDQDKLYFSRTIYVIDQYDIRTAIVFFNSRIFATALAKMSPNKIYLTVLSGLLSALTPNLTAQENLKKMDQITTSKEGREALISAYFTATHRAGVMSGMPPEQFKAAISQ